MITAAAGQERHCFAFIYVLFNDTSCQEDNCVDGDKPLPKCLLKTLRVHFEKYSSLKRVPRYTKLLEKFITPKSVD